MTDVKLVTCVVCVYLLLQTGLKITGRRFRFPLEIDK
jgi:hypothetical protein